jgi:hypothetical protein
MSLGDDRFRGQFHSGQAAISAMVGAPPQGGKQRRPVDARNLWDIHIRSNSGIMIFF